MIDCPTIWRLVFVTKNLKMKGSLKRATSAVEVTVKIIVSSICLHLIRLCKMVLRNVTVQEEATI